MTPGARIAAVIEILEKIELSKSPADDIVSSYVRSRRFIGSSDRRNIVGSVYRVLRRRARLDWLSETSSPRARTITDLFSSNHNSKSEVTSLFNGEGYAPHPLTNEEFLLLEKLKNKSFENTDYPKQIRAELPDWIAKILTKYWQSNFLVEAAALNRPASINLRVNTLKSNSEHALKVLRNDKIVAHATSISPTGLKLNSRINLRNSTAFKNGFIEIQEEGSQLIAALVDTKPNLKTIDLCAGAGGKTLALAAIMNNSGPLISCDTHLKRLKKLKPRLKRGGITNISIYHLSGGDDPFYSDHASTAERVLVDVPCSGSGAWRRTPAQKWQITEERLKELIQLQKTIMRQATQLVSVGGRLIYATCSILPN